MTAICASFADFKLIKGRKVCQLVCEVPLEQADAALAALGGLPNPHAERWVGIAPLTEQPQGKPTSGSAPSPSLADAADSPAAAPKPERKWDDIPPSQQAAITGEREDFQYWAHVRVGKIQRFDGRTFDWDRDGYGTAKEHIGVLFTRWYCGVSSRTELDTNPEAAARWRDLYGKFQTDTRYGDRR